MTKTTREALLERYHTYNARSARSDPKTERMTFKAFARNSKITLPARKDAAVLDACCGEGSFLLFLKDLGYQSLDGFDLSPENVDICRRRGLGNIELSDIFEWFSRPGKSWDAIFLIDVLEHVPKERAWELLVNVRNCLRDDGFVCIQMPNMGSLLGLYHRYGDLTHEFSVTEPSLASLLRAAGFARFEIGPSWNATTIAGYCREIYLRCLHRVFWLAYGKGAPRVPTGNLLAKAYR